MSRRVWCSVLALLIGMTSARADEGMWTLNNFPSARLKARYGFAPDQQWLDHVQRSAVRLAGGCSGSFVSPQGLVMTNHHCSVGCLQSLSTPQQDYVQNGFFAQTGAAELKCPGYEINQLVAMTDVTGQVRAATHGKEGAAYAAALKAITAQLEKGCGAGENTRCDLVTLYGGGRYDLYRYRRFQDVRLVFAPEKGIAFFGGDPDNFMFPRYDLDLTFLRVYDQGQPLRTQDYLRWSAQGAQPGMLTFTAGHPGTTERQLTIAQLEELRDNTQPDSLLLMAELRGLLTQYQTKGQEQARQASELLFGIENSFKAVRGEQRALLDRQFFTQKVAQERAFRQKVMANPQLKAQYGSAWDEIAKLVERERQLSDRYTYLEGGLPRQGATLYLQAIRLVRAAVETKKPNGERLTAYTDARLPQLRQALLDNAPTYPELETEIVTFWLTKMREALGPDDPAVKAIFGKQSPREIATAAIKGTRLGDVKVREALLNGGQPAIDAANDPLIQLAQRIDPFARAVRKQYEDEVSGPLTRAQSRLAEARFAAYGTSIYPDATFTLRLSYGQVKGWVENGRQVGPMTIVGGAYERHTGSDPFALPASWLNAKDKLNLQTPMNLVTTNDIIGGNSGSPLINQNAEVIGLIFDGNIHSLGGAFGFDETLNRAVAVHSNVILEALEKVYGAQRVLDEIRPGR